jgi:hypothetical protein
MAIFNDNGEIYSNDNGDMHNNFKRTNNRWSIRVNDVVQIPYVLDSAYTQNHRNTIKKALKDLEDRSKVVKFVLRNGQRDFLYVQRSGSCGSYIGKQGYNQIVYLPVDCFRKGTIQHEFMHALGIFHEQARSDRDRYVTINYKNVQSGTEHNFEKKKPSEAENLGTAYDYGSVMHYGENFYSKNSNPTIKTKKGESIGQRFGADDQDIIDIRLLYQCASGPRSIQAYESNRHCNSNCKCWEGESGCGGNSNACQGNLVCSKNECVVRGRNGGNRNKGSNGGKSLIFQKQNKARCLAINMGDNNKDIAFWKCNSNAKSQKWTLNQVSNRIQSGNNFCLNYDAGRNIIHAANCNGASEWFEDQQKRIRYGDGTRNGSGNGKCLTRIVINGIQKLTLKRCASGGLDYLNQKIAFGINQ